MNEELNKNIVWIDKKCERCGRSYPDTVLNIEGHIHHYTELECLDKKSCRRARRKQKGI